MKERRIMVTYKDPLSDTICVRWFRHIINARLFIRSFCYTIPYKITIDEVKEWRGSYNLETDSFIEMPNFGRVIIDGGLLDDKNIQD